MDSVKKLGFGLMRLPQKDGVIDIGQTARMADLFIERGFTYFDTAYTYTGSEEAFREAVVKRHDRNSFTIASKLPLFAVNEKADTEKIFDISRTRCGVEYFDYYLLHALRGGSEEQKKLDDFEIWDWLAEKKEKGIIRHYGFSFHGKADKLDTILTAHPEVDFVQLQINYADWDDDTIQSRLNWETARKHGKSVTVMEPVKGGSLVSMPEDIRQIFLESEPEASVASWAVRYAASLEGVGMVLSGMSSYEQIADNLSYMDPLVPMTDEELKVIGKVRAAIARIPVVPCTSCRYCTDGCPMNINIPEIIKTYNTYTIYGNLPAQKRHYGALTRRGGKASDCVVCRSCEGHCPQGIHITEHLKKASELFDD